MFGKNKFAQFLLSIIIVFTMTFSSGMPSTVAAQGKGNGIKREVNTETGKVSFIGPEGGGVVTASDALGISPDAPRPADPALALAKRYAPEFGLRYPARDLAERQSRRSENGRVTVRYQQSHQGIPVIGGELIVNTNDDGDLYSMNGEVSPGLSLSTEPAIGPEEARNTAQQAMKRWYRSETMEFVASDPELWIFDETLLGSGDRPAELVWRMEVKVVNNSLPIREFVLINAQTGIPSLHFNQIDTAWSGAASSSRTASSNPTDILPRDKNLLAGTASLLTYDAGSTSSLPGSFVCDESDLNCTGGDSHAKAAHKYAAGTYDLYFTKHGRDSIDGAGMTIISTVHYCDPLFVCPYANAFWDGTQMVYGGAYGFPLADDIVGHELTHGVTQHESGLLYWYQSGAIDESFADMWGEYFDQENSDGDDSDSAKWLLGEDISGLGAVRNMKNPLQFNQPDMMTSSKYYKNPGDNGGVHTNSGVNNKAVYLMVEGGTFNNKTIAPLGWGKTAAIYYEVQTNLLASGADYSDLYYALQQACTNLTGTLGITSDDCIEVKDALDAVQMNSPLPSTFNVDAPVCPTGMETIPSLNLFSDDLEGGSGNWTLETSWLLDDTYATSPTHNLFGNEEDPLDSIESSAEMSSTVSLPPNSAPFLHFRHAYLFDYFGSSYFNGGVLEYSIDGGSAWIDAKPLFSAGQNYKGKVVTSFGNPLGGRNAFAGDSHGYVSSLYNLSSLAGQNVQFRWRIGIDFYGNILGWFVDDVNIYTCVGNPAVPTLLLPKNKALTIDYTPSLDWSDVTGADHYELQIASDVDFTSIVYDETSVPDSQFDVPSDLDFNTTYYWKVKAVNSIGVEGPWSAVFNFRTALLPPTLASPANGFASLELRPPFDWGDDVSANGYLIQISTTPDFAKPIIKATAKTSFYVPTKDLPLNSTLHWRVQSKPAKGANGPSDWSEVRSFTTPVNPPPATTLLLPKNNALITDYTPLLSWKPVILPLGMNFQNYIIQVDDDPLFGSPAVNDSSITDINTVQFEPGSDLAPNTKYYWRVRLVNTDGELSNWSTKTLYFRTAILPPTLLTPADTSAAGSLRPTLDWDDVTGANGYTIQISTDPTFATKIVSASTVTSTYTLLKDLPPGTTIYWKVQAKPAKGSNGPSNWSVVFSFTTP